MESAGHNLVREIDRLFGSEDRRPMSQGSTPSTLADSELLSRIKAGNEAAFAEFYDRHSTLLYSIAMRVLADPDEAEEALQDAFRTIWERAALYNENLGKSTSWAVTILRDKAIDRLRLKQRQSIAIAKIIQENNSCPKQAPSANETIANEERAILRNALAAVPAEQKLAVELAFFTGLSQSEVANHLKEPLGTIKVRIRKGMLAMRDILEGQL
jgi:RNA polymerase sigma-70 factor, ECF subfamily